jgi:hypothetical protein
MGDVMMHEVSVHMKELSPTGAQVIEHQYLATAILDEVVD